MNLAYSPIPFYPVNSLKESFFLKSSICELSTNLKFTIRTRLLFEKFLK